MIKTFVHLYVYIERQNDKHISTMSNLQANCYFKLGFQKGARGYSDGKPKHPRRISIYSCEYKFDTKEFRGKKFSQLYQKTAQMKHPRDEA